jgi:hypothetical protein
VGMSVHAPVQEMAIDSAVARVLLETRRGHG